MPSMQRFFLQMSPESQETLTTYLAVRAKHKKKMQVSGAEP